MLQVCSYSRIFSKESQEKLALSFEAYRVIAVSDSFVTLISDKFIELVYYQ